MYENEGAIVRGENAVETESLTRRSFLGVLLGFGTVVMGAALSVPLIRFALHPLLAKTTEIGWSDVGKIDEFASLREPMKKLITVEQRDGWRKIVSEKKQQFICPCHTAVFALDGARISGPAPRAMDDLESKIDNGMLKVRYQYFRQLISKKEVLA